VHALDDVTAVVEDTADVLSVHGAGEVRITVMTPVSASCKLITDEVLGPGHSWVLSGEDFLSKQILLVEEENHRDGAQPSRKREVDALEEVQSLLQAVGLVVLPDDHVVAAAGHHEDDGSHVVEALDPLAALVALAAHIEHSTVHLLEVDFVHLELGLKDSGGQDAAAKQDPAYLVARHVVGLLDHINLRGTSGYLLLGAVNQLVFIRALVAGTHSLILPQSLGMWEVKVRNVHHAQDVIHSELVLRVGQLHRGDQVAHGGHNGTYFNGLLQVVFDVLHLGGLLTTVGLKRKIKSYCILPTRMSPSSRYAN
uniref:Predicted gene, 20721 n=1 Tax=Nannospalax galili TaxID=1026970 RepID=A0A8C6RTP8_NANGA